MARYAARDLTALVKAAEVQEGSSGDASARLERIAALAKSMYCPPAEAAFSGALFESLVRLAEFALISLAGLAIYFLGIERQRGFEWPCLILIPTMAAAVVVVLQSLGSIASARSANSAPRVCAYLPA